MILNLLGMVKYELVVDMSFGNNLIQSKVLLIKLHNNMPVKLLLVRVKIGFQPIKYQQNADGSNTLVLERWNS
jgi:hypothetical protein